MVGGDDYASAPFNLATQGQRQPGSAFKPFVLAEALRRGIGPELGVGVAEARLRRARTTAREKFDVNNYEDDYARRARTLARATTFSDNAVYAQVGIKVGTQADRAARASGWASARRSPTTRR